jgi:hypothetical protein
MYCATLTSPSTVALVSTSNSPNEPVEVAEPLTLPDVRASPVMDIPVLVVSNFLLPA